MRREQAAALAFGVGLVLAAVAAMVAVVAFSAALGWYAAVILP